jgi:putative transposase
VAELIRKVGISEQTFYWWKKQYAGPGSGELRELRQLRDENGRLKRLVADATLDRVILQDVLAKKRPHALLILLLDFRDLLSREFQVTSALRLRLDSSRAGNIAVVLVNAE